MLIFDCLKVNISTDNKRIICLKNYSFKQKYFVKRIFFSNQEKFEKNPFLSI